MRDALSGIQIKRAISPISVADNTPQVSQVIDRRGFDSVTFIIATGSLADADATFAVQVEESDAASMSGATVVADGDLVSQTSGVAPRTAAAFTFAADDNVRSIGYVGVRRYVRLTITPSNNAAAALLAAVAVLGNPSQAPVIKAAA